MKTNAFVLFVSLGLASASQAGDIWVDDDGDNGSGTGSSSQPYKTVTYVLFNNLAAAGDTIKVKAGTYDEALGEVFPLIIPNQVRLVGTEYSSGVPLALIGGDIADSTVLCLVGVDATSGDRISIDISGLKFLGENTASKDAPSAIHVLGSSGNVVRVTISNCVVERSEMNDSGAADKSSIHLNLGHGDSLVTVADSEIWPSRRAGIEIVAGNGTSGYGTDADTTVAILRNDFSIEGTDVADWGIRWTATGEKWVEGSLVARANSIDSSGASSGYGIGTGISVLVQPDGDGNITFDHDDEPEISANTITGCTDHGVELANDPLDGNGHMSIWKFERNRVSDCGGAALRIVKDEVGGLGGYLNLISRSNFYVDCSLGVQMVGAEDGPLNFVNDTISGNSDWGFQLVDGAGGPTCVINCIVWGNGGCGNCSQIDEGTSDWNPECVEYNDFDNFTGGTGNIDEDPDFVNATSGNYHLASTSPCIDAGINDHASGLGLSEFDIDNQDRVEDGDGDEIETVDIGADEYVP